MRLISQILLIAALTVFTGCGTDGSAQGSGSESAGYGHVKVGFPF